jgi:hypothetical protein
MGVTLFPLVIVFTLLRYALYTCAAVLRFGIALRHWIFLIIIFADAADGSGFYILYACYWILSVLIYAGVFIVRYGISIVIYVGSGAVICAISLVRYLGAGVVVCGIFILHTCYWTSLFIIRSLPSTVWTLTLFLTAYLITCAVIAQGLGMLENTQGHWWRSAIQGASLNWTLSPSDPSKPVAHDHVNRVSKSSSGAEGGEKIVIAVMGVTGAGKSSFIKNITGSQDVLVGHGLESSTVFSHHFKS